MTPKEMEKLEKLQLEGLTAPTSIPEGWLIAYHSTGKCFRCGLSFDDKKLHARWDKEGKIAIICGNCLNRYKEEYSKDGKTNLSQSPNNE
jgi:hypothetical protein